MTRLCYWLMQDVQSKDNEREVVALVKPQANGN